MNVRALGLLAAAAVCGGIAVFMARGWLATQIPEPMTVITEPTISTTTVVVASRDLFFGDKLARAYVEQREWPTNSVPEGSFETINEILEGERVVLRTVAKNEPILVGKLSGEGGRATLSSVIDTQMRAITIRVNDILGVAGFVLPGDHIDIMLTREVSEDNPVTDVLLQNVKVLGIDQDANDQENQPKVARAITLEVTPRQAQKLVLAAEVGRLSLALRNYVNSEPAPAKRVSIRDLTVGEVNQSPNPVLAEKPRKPVRSVVARQVDDPFAKVTVTRGMASSEYKVRPAPPRPSAYIGFGGGLSRAPSQAPDLLSGLRRDDAAATPSGTFAPAAAPVINPGFSLPSGGSVFVGAPTDIFPADDANSLGGASNLQ